jgi:hypothetical protein
MRYTGADTDQRALRARRLGPHLARPWASVPRIIKPCLVAPGRSIGSIHHKDVAQLATLRDVLAGCAYHAEPVCVVAPGRVSNSVDRVFMRTML